MPSSLDLFYKGATPSPSEPTERGVTMSDQLPATQQRGNLSRGSTPSTSTATPRNISQVQQDSQVPQDRDLSLTSCAASRFYYSKNMSKRSLFAMVCGLDIVDLNSAPWNEATNQREFLPTQADLAAEVIRHFHNYQGLLPRLPKPSNKTKKRLIDDLSACKIPNSNCIRFLEQEVADYKIRIELLNQNERDQEAIVQERAALWRGNEPWLRLIYCFTLDNVKEAFLNRDRCLSRAELDRNFGNKKTWQQVVAEAFNNPYLVARIPAQPSLHRDFSKEQRIQLSDCPGELQADQVLKKMQHFKGHYVAMKNAFDLSGSGDGMIQNGVPVSGEKSDFLKGRGSYMLYYWDCFESQDIMDYAMAFIPDAMARNSSDPFVSTQQRKKAKYTKASDKAQEEKLQKEKKANETLDAISMMARTYTQTNRIDNQQLSIQDQIAIINQDRLLILDMINQGNPRRKEEYYECLERLQEKLQHLYCINTQQKRKTNVMQQSQDSKVSDDDATLISFSEATRKNKKRFIEAIGGSFEKYEELLANYQARDPNTLAIFDTEDEDDSSFDDSSLAAS